MAASVMGLPVEEDHNVIERVPWATLLTALLILVVSVAAFVTGLEEAVQEYALIPADLFRKGGITLLTSFLLHGGIWHLVGNLYFLILVGDNVEDFAGKLQFLGVWKQAMGISNVSSMAHLGGACIGFFFWFFGRFFGARERAR